MNVKNLINDLLECEMDSAVEIIILSDGSHDEEFNDVEFSIKRIFDSEYAQIHVHIGSKILVEESEFNALEERIQELEAEIEDLKAK